MTRINTNVASLRGLRSLNRANDLQNTALTRLSTGLKINSGKDNPAGLIAGETLRSQISSIEQSIKNSNRANNVLATADAALGEVNNLLNQVRGLVQETLNSGALSQSEVEANQLQVDAALSAINRISANTTFAGDKLIDGSKAFVTNLTKADSAKLADFQINEAVFSTSSTIEIEAAITQAAEKAELRYGGGNLNSASTVELSGTKGSQVIFLGGASTTGDIKNAINAASDVTGVKASFDPGLTFGLEATKSFANVNTGTASVNTLDSQFGATSTALSTLTFTDARATQTQGSDASLGGTISVVFADTVTAGTTTNTASVSSVATTANGDTTITIEIGNSTSGTAAVTSTITDITALINSGTSANAVAARSYVSASGSTAVTVSTAASADLAGGDDVADIKFLDNRNDGSGGSVSALGGEVFVQFVDSATGTSSASASISSVSTNAETGDTTIQIQLAKTSGTTTSTISDILALVNSGTSTNAIAAQSFISAEATSADSTNTSTFSVQTSATQLLGGNDGANNDITFNDARAYGTDGVVNVVFASTSAANATLSVSVAATGTSDNTITVNLATDEFGNVTSTADEIRTFISTDTSDGAATARGLVNVEVEGNGSEAVTAQAQQTVDIASRILKLNSSEFGENQFVAVNVLDGGFSTTTTDNVTESSRDTGKDLEAVINGQVAQTSGLQARIKTASLDASLSFNEDNNVRGRRANVTITGGGSLFQIGQEVSAAGQIGIGIEAVNTARLGGIAGKLYELGSGAGKSLLDIGPDTPGSALVDIVEQSINRVSTLRGRLGAIQKNVIDTNVNSLGVALENISEARSVIVDTDFAETTAELTKSQILSQSGISVLAIANQNPSQVLSLLG
ncbi:flagellin N-terminal helical domain-containing protein [Rubinisphaera italica]|uniref:Flagellin n=1 Tax=Rubinisphaera italica TaxID=2527969 RepID=A0A5C5X9F0_9PLAN|nr:flagellin [Rubinisphaera italica]TWT59339.1 B-type flagellin [Rubinisphaera italica]